MILLKINDNYIKQDNIGLSLLTNKNDLVDNPIIEFFNQVKSTEQSVFSVVLFDEFEQFYQNCPNVLLTADNTPNEIDTLIAQFEVNCVLFFVQDFKDGRTFSLIRHLKKLNFLGDIYLLGDYGLDQASYYHGLGVSGFVVDDDKVNVLLHTLAHLKSAQQGISAHSLPMFR